MSVRAILDAIARLEKKIDDLAARDTAGPADKGIDYAAFVDPTTGIWAPPELTAWAKQVEEAFPGLPVGDGWRGSKNVREVGTLGRQNETVVAVPVGILCRHALNTNKVSEQGERLIASNVAQFDGLLGFGPVVQHATGFEGEQFGGLVTIRSGAHAESWAGILGAVRDWIEGHAFDADPGRKPAFRLS